MSRVNEWTYELVKEKVELLNYKIISCEYINVNSKLTLVDKDNYYYITPFYSLLKNKTPEKFHSSNPYSIHNIKNWCKLYSKSFILLSDTYCGNDKNLQWKCLICGCEELFKATWSNIQNNKGCPYCSGQKTGISNCLATKRPDLASEWHTIKNGNLSPYNVTCYSNKKIWWQCLKNPKHIWNVSVVNRSKGNGCPYCAGQFPSEDYNLLVINPELCEEWDYNKNKIKPEEYLPHSNKYAWWKCKYGHSWKSLINSRTSNNKVGCPECNLSKGEKNIEKFLVNNNINFLSQKTFDGLIGLGGNNLLYDFYLPDYNLLIEYDGEYHYQIVKYKNESSIIAKKRFEKNQIHDNRKNEYALNKNIHILRIPFWEYSNIEEILENKLKEYKIS